MADGELEAKALLIDNDGVLVDSLASIETAFVRWGALHEMNGKTIYRDWGGHRSREIALALFGAERASDCAGELDRLEFEESSSVRALPGAKELLISVGSAWTLVTSGPGFLARARLAAAGLAEPMFLIGAEDVTLGKPDPQGYLLAARLNGVAPWHCIALEDSRAGVAAGVAAGCQTIRVGDRDLPGQAFRIPSLRHIAVSGRPPQFVVNVWGADR